LLGMKGERENIINILYKNKRKDMENKRTQNI